MKPYYQLVDRSSSNVSPIWKATHIGSMIIVVIASFATAYTFGRSIEAFGDHCVLNARIEFDDKNNTETTEYPLPSHLKAINIRTSDWGSMKLCYFCQFTPVMSMITGIIWTAMFIICSRGGTGYISDMIYRSWQIVWPALIFAAISALLMLISTLKMSEGVTTFCSQFESVFNSTKCGDEIDEYTLSFNSHQRTFVWFLRMAVTFSYICFGTWLLQLITLILRILCIVDFQMIKLTVIHSDGTQEVIEAFVPARSSSFLEDSVVESDISDEPSRKSSKAPLIKPKNKSEKTLTSVEIDKSGKPFVKKQGSSVEDSDTFSPETVEDVSLLISTNDEVIPSKTKLIHVASFDSDTDTI